LSTRFVFRLRFCRFSAPLAAKTQAGMEISGENLNKRLPVYVGVKELV
jgi:hypothetical protein